MCRFHPALMYTSLRMDYSLTSCEATGDEVIFHLTGFSGFSLLTEKVMILRHQTHPSLQEWLTDMTKNLIKIICGLDNELISFDEIHEPFIRCIEE